MTLAILPDPSHGAGGHALLRFEAAGGVPAEVTVAVMETFAERWLAPSATDATGRIAVGNPNWQAGRHEFGPYPVRPCDGGAEIGIGPEIVNKIEGYTQLRILAGPFQGQASWPDDIVPCDEATQRIGLQVVRKAGAAAGPDAALRRAAPASPPEPEPGSESVAAAQIPQGDAEILPPRPKGRLWLMIAFALVALLALAAAAYFYWPRPEPPAPEPPPAAEAAQSVPPAAEAAQAVPPAAAAVVDPCTAQSLSGLGRFEALKAAVAACGGTISADQMLGFIETAAAKGDAAALLLFGTLYDGAVTDTVVEAQLGVSFGDTPAQAAEYYFRAAAAGSAEARDKLTAVCARLLPAGGTLAQGAHDDFCH